MLFYKQNFHKSYFNLNELTKRILVALIGIPIVFAAVWYGGWFFYTLLFLINAFAIDEFYNMVRFKTQKLAARFLYIFSSQIFFGLAYYLFNKGLLIYFLFVIPIFPIYLSFFDLRTFTDHGLTRISSRVYGYFYITLAMIAFYFIRQIDLLLVYVHPDYVFTSLFNESNLGNLELLKSTLGAKILFSIFASVWVCDSAAYFTGRAIGKHKFAEKVSPKKTWEGAIGGLVGAMIVGVLFYFLDSFEKSYIYLIIAFICGTVGQYGDLVESLIKRDVGVKDSSNLIPGHGGVLDRIDSLLAVSPFILLTLVILL